MARKKRGLWLAGLCALIALFGVSVASAQSTGTGFLAKPPQSDAAEPRAPHPAAVLTCRGPITQVSDVGFEGVLATPFSFPVPGGGGDGACLAPVPILSTTVNLAANTCLDAHFSAIVGNSLTYGVAPLAMFQVTLTNLLGGAPQHMVGHYETPYGIYCPAVAIEAERDVDTFGSNFFQRVGTQPGDVPPGTYRVDVWWAGAPPFAAPGGAIGAAFVLKLYLR